jgi:hypothetical protein
MNPKSRGECCSRTCAAILRNSSRTRKPIKIKRELICVKCGESYSAMCSDFKFKKSDYSKFCSLKCANSRKFSDDERIKLSKLLKSKYKDGTFVAVLKGKKMPKSTKEKISEKIAKYHNENSNTGYKSVKWYRVKNCIGKEFNVRGTYELRVSEFLNDHNIIWVNDKRLTYYDKDGCKKHYIPDFYLPDYDYYLEPKGYYSDKNKEKMKLVLEQNEINLIMVFEKDLKNLIEIILKKIA